MKKFNKSLIAATIAILSSSSFAENHIAQVDDQGHIKKDFALTQEAGQVTTATKTSKAPSVVDTSYSGQAAIDFLGNQINSTAESHNYEVESFKKLLLTDPTYHVDENGKVFVIDEAPSKGALASYSQASTSTVKFTGDATKLHSKPGASKVIYIDVDGFDATNTIWNKYLTSSNGQLDKWNSTPSDVFLLWSVVSEDYAPFDVDVTTEEPAPAALLRTSVDDINYGFRVVVTDTPHTTICGPGGCGGIAYVGSVKNIVTDNNFLQPALVFSILNTAKNMAEAVSHESGHALGLFHDGVIGGSSYYFGDSEWAPIMGASYYSKIGQFSKGEYPNANNKQDDLLVISQNFPYIANNKGHDLTSAQGLEIDSYHLTTVNIKDVKDTILNSNDKAYYTFTTSGGDVALTVSPMVIDPSLNFQFWGNTHGNLNPKIEILDSNGTKIDAYTSTAINGIFNAKTIGATLPSGKYYVTVEGQGLTGFGGAIEYTTYGSIGQYSLSGFYTPEIPTVPPTAVITNSVTEGVGPLTVNFTSENSTIGFGSSLTYTWIYDDGSPIETGNTSTHTFKSTGDHIVTLQVKNEADLVNTTTVKIDVDAPLVNIAKVKSLKLALSYNKKSNLTIGTASITVLGENNKGLIGTVCGYFDGSFYNPSDVELKYRTVCGTTAKNGTVKIKTPVNLYNKNGTLSFTITSVSKQNIDVVLVKELSKQTTVIITK